MRRSRYGFTLVELMVVILILVVIATLVVAAYRTSAGGDRLRSAARTTQSAFLGAKDRALHAKDRRGVRLLQDAGDRSLVNGFVYLQPIEMQTYGEHSIQLERDQVTGLPDVVIVHGNTLPLPADTFPDTDWANISWAFANPPRIRIPAGSGQWYTFTTDSAGMYTFGPTTQYLRLTTPFPDPGVPGPISHPYSDVTFTSCDFEMAPEILPNHAPLTLPSGVVIDLYWSQLPPNWRDIRSVASGTTPGAGEFNEGPDPAIPGNVILARYGTDRLVPTLMDLMYSPRGVITGPVAAQGPIHLLLRDIQDATQNLSPISPQCKGECRVLTIFPMTGHVQVYEMDPTDVFVNVTNTVAGATAGADGFPDNPFRFAKEGSRAGN